MREILFRGKRIDNGEWVYGYFYEECDNTYIIQDRQNTESLLCRNTPHKVDHDTVGQYTGHPQDLYDGDIVSGIRGLGTAKFEVFWDKQFCAFKLQEMDGRDGMRTIIPLCTVDAYTLHGNIYDNPELLNQ